MQDTKNFTPITLIWTFAGCLGIYIFANGIINIIPQTVDFLFGALFRQGYDYTPALSLILPALKILVGVLLFQRAMRELR